MTKKTKLLSAFALTSLLVSGVAFADHGQRGWKGSCDKKMGREHHRAGKMPMMKILKQLDLSSAQKEKIRTIFKEAKKQKQGLNDAFTKSSFDKDKFIKIMNEKRENMVKSKADIIEKVYAVLDSKQKEQFKVLADLQKAKMQKRFHHKG